MRAEFCISFCDLTSQTAAFVLNRGNVQIHLNLQVVEHPFPELEPVAVSILPPGLWSEGETPSPLRDESAPVGFTGSRT